MTLGDVVEYEGGAGTFNAARRSFTPRIGEGGNDRGNDTDDTKGAGGAGGSAALSQGGEPDRSIAEDGTDLLSAYLQSRRATT
jgi:hypothetical protein